MRICRIFWVTANISDFSDKDDYDDECRRRISGFVCNHSLLFIQEESVKPDVR